MSKTSKKKSNKSNNRKADKKKQASASGVKEIAQAEKRLEQSLTRLDEVRSELAERESALRGLLEKYGRLPAQEDEEPETEPLFDQRQVVNPLGGLSDDGPEDNGASASVSVPLLDQQQVLEVGSRKPVEHEN